MFVIFIVHAHKNFDDKNDYTSNGSVKHLLMHCEIMLMNREAAMEFVSLNLPFFFIID